LQGRGDNRIVNELINDKGALYEVLRAEADHCADLLRQGKGPVLAYPDGMQLATLLGKAADEIERLRGLLKRATESGQLATKVYEDIMEALHGRP
jgi:hypothetical protein